MDRSGGVICESVVAMLGRTAFANGSILEEGHSLLS